jgi:acetyltransferase-like isoleucine patch superfamily enzyme
MVIINKKPGLIMKYIYKIINKIFIKMEKLRWKSHYMGLANDFRFIGKNVTIDYGVSFGNPKNIYIENDVFIGANVILNAGKGGSIKLCEGSAIGAGSTFITWNLNIMDKRNLTRYKNENIFKDIVIGRGAGLGYSCTVNPGVTLGDGCEVAAGSVLASDFKEFEIVSGAPAIVIAKRRISN